MAEKETSLQKIQRLISTQKNIRNVATSAHIHHGKCISGDSRIMLTDGNIRLAKDIFDEVSKNGDIYEENEDHTVYAPKEKIEIFSLNKNEGKIEKKDIQYVWRLKGGNTIKIKLRNGFEITTTPEHKYIVFRDGFVDAEAKDLRLGDRVVCSRKLDIISNVEMKKDALNLFSQKNFYVKLSNEFNLELKNKIRSYGIKNIRTTIKPASVRDGINKNRYNIKDYLEICRTFEINLNDAYDKIDLIFYRSGKQRGQNASTMRLPKTEQEFKELFYLAGLFIGDGSGRKFIAGKDQLAIIMQDICRKFLIKTRRVERRDRTPEIHTDNLTLVQIFNSLFDYPLKKKSHNVKISQFVWKSNNEYTSHLLKGYFDTDGCVEKSRRAITISSASRRMIEDLHLLLLRFGCISIKEKDNTISISGTSAINFQKEIGFVMNEKSEKLRNLVGKVSGSIVCDTIKVGDQVMLINKKVKDYSSNELAYVEVNQIESSFEEVVYDFTIPENHNFVAEGMVIHNTAFTDVLLAAAGLMSEKAAGDLEQGMTTWQHADEQERLMTVDAANVSMAHKYADEEYLINLIDTPGHVDFGGNVTRAMRAIDGTFVLVCASEGIMPQTETVLKQAIRERVKPVLFINKVDRLIRELKLTPEGMQERFMKIIEQFNNFIMQIAEPEFKEKWKVNVADGSVAFGSARDNWALSLPFMKKNNVSFKDIIKLYEMEEADRKKWVWQNAPLHDVILDIAVKHLPNPLEAQKYRIPKIWRGDPESKFGQELISCSKEGEVGFVITRIIIDPKSGKEIAAGRLYSGTIVNGMEVYANNAKKSARIQQVLVYNGIKPEQVERVPAGNVLAITGLNVDVGETITLQPQTPFEEIKHIFQPVITKSIEVVRSADLPKLIEVLRKVGKEDPSIKIEINEETGENLLSGMGELHLEIIEGRIKNEKGLEVKTGNPIVVYRETVTKPSSKLEIRTPNGHNIFFFSMEPLEEEVYNAIERGDLPEERLKKRAEVAWKKLSELGISNEEARQYKEIYKGNVFEDRTRGLVLLGEVIDSIMDGWKLVIDAGPLAREPLMKTKIILHDAKLHVDHMHRGPAQIYPAVRNGMFDSMTAGGAGLVEPVQTHRIEVPVEFMGTVTSLVGGKRGVLINVEQEGPDVVIVAKIPVAEMIGWSNDLRSATEGRGISSLADQQFQKLPRELQENVIRKIRERKGLSENQ
ncbi:MAG: elongation factor EF-2 [Nanoarchaeota archaeon]|nr:elongation factor EF-2 [Nanoarchaeota archaeon]